MVLGVHHKGETTLKKNTVADASIDTLSHVYDSVGIACMKMPLDKEISKGKSLPQHSMEIKECPAYGVINEAH